MPRARPSRTRIRSTSSPTATKARGPRFTPDAGIRADPTALQPTTLAHRSENGRVEPRSLAGSPRIGGSPLIEPGQDARGAGHVAAVIVAKDLDHQRLLAPDAQEEQRPEADQARRACDPIRQQER